MSESTKEILIHAVRAGASDIFIVAGKPLCYKINGLVTPVNEERLLPDDTDTLIGDFYQLANRSRESFDRMGDDDFSFSLSGTGRFRVNTYRQRGSVSAVLRVVYFTLPQPSELNIPGNVMELAERTTGLVLVTGPAGSGKSTTLSCIIDRINHSRSCHIMTLEDPIEFLHRHGRSIVSQREISIDTKSYLTGLRAAMRQSPDVILIGEMRDLETMRTAMLAAETGHLVLSTLHTLGASNSVNRIIDIFPPEQQHQARVQLSLVLQAIVSQQLLTTVDGTRLPAFEVLHATTAVRNLIRESKAYQIDNIVQTGHAQGMISMDQYLADLFRSGRISREEALLHALSPETLMRLLTQR